MHTAQVKCRLIFVKAVVLFDLQTEAGIIGCCLFKTKCTDLILTHIRFSFTDVYINLRHTDCVYQNTCQNGYLNNFVCMFPSVEAVSELCIGLHVRASVCAAAAERRKWCASPNSTFTLWWLNLSVNP